MIPIVKFDLSNEDYHESPEWADYISSTELKHYAVSPKFARQMMLEPKPLDTPSVLLGSKFHDCMEQIVRGATIGEIFTNRYIRFDAPINPTTGEAYGSTTKKYREAYDEFLISNPGKKIVSDGDYSTLKSMVEAAMANPIVQKFIRWGKPDEERFRGPEISVFAEVDGVKVKVRADLVLRNKIIDWKSSSMNEMTPDSINKAILSFGYDVSAAFYQKVFYELTQEYYDFYEVFVQNHAPFEVAIVDMRYWAHTIVDGELVNSETRGCQECNALLSIHKKCLEENNWPGAEIFVEPDDNGNRILTPEPPMYSYNTITKAYN